MGVLRHVFRDDTLYQIELFWGVLNVIFGLIGLYFVYRWGVTLLSTDDSVRRILMGEPFFTWFASNDSVILIFASAYLGFKLLYMIITTARWEINMEHTRRKLINARSRKTTNTTNVPMKKSDSQSSPVMVYAS